VFSVSDLLFPTVITSRLSCLATNSTYYVFVCQPRDSRQGSWHLQCGNEQQTEVKYICVKFVVDDGEMVPFPEFFEDIQNLLHADLLYSPEVLQGNRSIYTIIRNIIAWYVDKAPPFVDEPERPKYAPYEGTGSSISWVLTIFLYGIYELETRTALMNLELAIMKGQESAKKVARELEVDFDENGGIVTPFYSPHADAQQFGEQHPYYTRFPSQCDQQQPRAGCGPGRGHHGRKDVASRRNGGYRKSCSFSPAPQLVL
jgi:hypothetical protein